jgi:chromosome segregation ATPase
MKREAKGAPPVAATPEPVGTPSPEAAQRIEALEREVALLKGRLADAMETQRLEAARVMAHAERSAHLRDLEHSYAAMALAQAALKADLERAAQAEQRLSNDLIEALARADLAESRLADALETTRVQTMKIVDHVERLEAVKRNSLGLEGSLAEAARTNEERLQALRQAKEQEIRDLLDQADRDRADAVAAAEEAGRRLAQDIVAQTTALIDRIETQKQAAISALLHDLGACQAANQRLVAECKGLWEQLSKPAPVAPVASAAEAPLDNRLAALESALREHQEQLNAARRAHEAMRLSTSWRLTAPLRAMRRLTAPV